jgi:hypothetical protein
MNLRKKFFNKDIYVCLVAISINCHGGNLGYNLLLSRAFSVGIPLTAGFRPQLVVVSGLSVGIPLTVGFRPQFVVVLGLSVGIPLTVGFRLSRSLWLSQSPFTDSSYFTMEFWLSRGLSHELFSFTSWNFGCHRAFSRFFSHNGISAITKLFHKFFFHIMESRLSRRLFTIFSFTQWNFGYHGAFS